MNASILRRILVPICLLAMAGLHAQSGPPRPNWDRAMALRAIDEASTGVRLEPLYHMARVGRSADLLQALIDIAEEAALSDPARDYLVYSFTLGLGDLNANVVSPRVMEFLLGYRSRTWVAQADHPGLIVPLFNVRAAAAGTLNGWKRQQAAGRAERMLQGAVGEWVDAYLAAGPAGRRGFIDALDSASPEQLHELGRRALGRLDGQPELTLVVARAGLDSGDLELFGQAISRGGGPDLSRVLRVAASKLSAQECTALLEHALGHASHTAAALAIAELAPAQLNEPAIRDMLFGKLSDRNLGAGAALVLGASSDPDIQRRLQAVAAQESGLARSRALLAIHSHGKEGEARQ